jgi:SH3-like domain-containing protein
VMVESNDVLNIRSGPGVGYSIVGSFEYNASSVMRSGSVMPVGDATWYQVQNPSGGTGWVNSYYLSEYVPSGTFCSDTRIQSLFVQLQQAVNTSDGTLFASLVSPNHSVEVRYRTYNAAIHYTRAQAAGVFTSTAQQNWGGGPSGLDTIGTFADVIQPKLQEVLNAAYESYCNNPRAASTFAQPWPGKYTNFNYYSLFKPGTPGVDLDYRQWMIGIEYVRGQPYLSVFIHVEWEP